MDKISFNFNNKTAVITGGAQGFGLDIAKRLLNSGAKVIIWDIDSEMIEKSLKELNNSNLSSNVIDVSNFKEVEKCVNEITKNSNIDILINNAGVGSSNQHFQAVSLNPWLEVLKVNLIAPLMITQAIIKNVKISSAKKIYFLSSQLGSIEDNNSGGMYIYRSSKSGLNQVVKSLSIDLKAYGITVISLHPGWVKTDR